VQFSLPLLVIFPDSKTREFSASFPGLVFAALFVAFQGYFVEEVMIFQLFWPRLGRNSIGFLLIKLENSFVQRFYFRLIEVSVSLDSHFV